MTTQRKARPAELSAIRQTWADLGGLLRRTGMGGMLAPNDARLVAMASTYAASRYHAEPPKK